VFEATPLEAIILEDVKQRTGLVLDCWLEYPRAKKRLQTRFCQSSQNGPAN